MNLWQPLKLHYYTYRKIYFYFWALIFIISYGIMTFFTKVENIYIILTTLILSLFFSFTLGTYEYNHLSNHYINLKTVRKEFYYSSLIENGINALIQISGFAVTLLIINNIKYINDIFPNTLFSTYVLTFFINILLFSIGNIVALLFKNIKYIRLALYLFTIIIVSLFFFDYIFQFIEFVKTLYINYISIQLFIILILLTGIIQALIFIKFIK